MVKDPSESHNLRADPADDYSEKLWKQLTAMLKERAATGPPLTSAFPLGEKNATAATETCDIANRTGFLFPVDF